MSVIEALCNQLIAEATAVKDYTRDLEALMENPNGRTVTDLFDDIRIDEVEHIQKLALALTACFYEAGEKSSNGFTQEETEQEG